MAEENAETVQPPQPTPAATREHTIESAATSLESLLGDDGSLLDAPQEQAEEKPEDRDERGRFKAGEQQQEERPEEQEDAAPDDWSEEQKAAYVALQPEHRAILAAADKARRSAIEAERAQHAETLKAAQDYPARLKALEDTYSKLAEIKAEKAELLVTMKREFSDIKSDADRLALTDVNSPKYDVVRAQRLESLLTMAREMTSAEAAADHNRRQALDAEEQKDKQAQEAKVYELIPEWGKLRQEGKMPDLMARLTEVREHLKSRGIPAKEADALYNAHYIDIARDAMLYRKAQAEEAQRRKAGAGKLQAAPKVQKPGAGRQQTAAQERLTADLQRVRQTGRLDDAAKALEHFIQ